MNDPTDAQMESASLLIKDMWRDGAIYVTNNAILSGAGEVLRMLP